MNKMNRIGWAVLSFVGWTLCAAEAQQIWTNTAGGFFHDPANWQTNVPAAGERADFNVNGTYLVTFTNDANAALQTANNPNLTFDLGGFRFTRPNAIVNFDIGNNATLLVTNGVFDSLRTFGIAYGGTATSTSRVTIGQGAVWYQSNAVLAVGYRYRGELHVVDGGKLLTDTAAGQIRIGRSEGGVNGTGLISVSGVGSVWTNMNVFSAANDIRIGNDAGGTGTVNVTQGGLLVNMASHIRVGYAGVGSLNITSGGVLDNRKSAGWTYIYVGELAGAEGTITVSGTNSALRLGTNYLQVGQARGAKGTVILEDGGTFSSERLTTVGHRSTEGLMIVRNGGLIDMIGVGSGGGIQVGGDDANAANGGYGRLILTNSGSKAILADLTAGHRFSTGDVVIADGATVEMYRHVMIGVAITNASNLFTAKGSITVTGEDSVLKRYTGGAILGDAGSTSLGVGAGGWGGWDLSGLLLPNDSGHVRGEGLLVVEDGGLVQVDSRISLFSNSTIRIDGGRTISSNIGMETGSVFQVVLGLADANAAQALMTSSGEVRIWGATLDVQLADGYTPAVDDLFKLIDGSAFDSQVINRFSMNGSILADESTFSVGATDFRIDYFGGDVFLTVIPEPGTLGLIATGLGLAAILRRRKA
ncbi:MAG: PEP-CTERM sorting domain-containing protein [Kiritimatiellia bacterium]|nr:PEP-CTERM sorting domain-containing protein [Kiritimatiellia bacterium]